MKKKSGFIKINKVLPARAKQYKLEQPMLRYQALKSWPEVIGGFFDAAKEQTKAIDLRGGVLTIACLSKELAFQIKLLAQRIIYALNEFLGRRIVYAIKVEI